jgi:hypothetical protein
MGVTKDIFDIVTEQTPLGKWLARFKDTNERKRLLETFCPDFRQHAEHETLLQDYYQWNDEAALWATGDGDVYGTSYREFLAFWSTPAIYQIYEATLLRYIRAGGSVHRTIVVGEEYFDPKLQLLLLRTGMRQSILGLEPLVAHRLDIAAAKRNLGVDCDMLGIANNRIGYFIRLSPAPCIARTTNKKFIRQAWETYRDMSKDAHAFQEWARQRSFADRIPEMLPDIEEECRLITEFTDACKPRND